MENLTINRCICGGVGNLIQVQNNPVEYSIRCDNCGMLAIPQESQELLIEVWNKVNPAISTARQAIYWLEKGEKIRASHWDKYQYIFLDTDKVICFQDRSSYESFHEQLFMDTWELYKEPKYRYGNFNEAREAHKQGKKISIESSADCRLWNDGEVSLIYLDYQGYLLKDLETGSCFGLFDKVLDSDKWKIYD